MSSKLYDLTNLKKDFQNDKEAISEMIRIFLEFTPINLVELNNAINDSDYKAIAAVAHKMKYSMSNYGINSVKDDIVAIEMLSKQSSNIDEIKIIADKVNVALNQVMKSIRQEIN